MMRLFFLSLIGFLSFSLSMAWGQKSVSLVVDVNEDIPAQVKLVQCVFDQLPEKLDVVEMPWKRGQLATEIGTVDGFFIAARTPKRDEYADYSEALREISWFYILPKSSALNSKAENFHQAAFASSRGTRRLQWLQDELRKHNPENEVEIVANATQGLSSLNKGQFDILLSNQKSFDRALFQLGLERDDFKTYHVRTISGAVYFGHKFLQDNPDFLSRFNQHTDNCRNS